MDNQKENSQREQGSVQRQTQKNQQYSDDNKPENEGRGHLFGVIQVPQVKKDDVDINKSNDEGIYEKNDDVPDLKDIDDEKIIPGLRAKQNLWNSVTFDSDDFFEE